MFVYFPLKYTKTIGITWRKDASQLWHYISADRERLGHILMATFTTTICLTRTYAIIFGSYVYM